MSILIKGMEMPTDGNGICIDWHGDVSMIVNEIKAVPTAHAVELPPHGRLIDADALNDMINRSYPMTDRNDVHIGYAICQEMIKQIPTIIESEG